MYVSFQFKKDSILIIAPRLARLSVIKEKYTLWVVAKEKLPYTMCVRLPRRYWRGLVYIVENEREPVLVSFSHLY
jgi:hypothetical protein